MPIEVYVCQVEIDKVSQLQWTLRDITERKNLDTTRNDLISMIYHDLRSPLANVVSSLDVLETMLPKETEPMLKPLLDIALRSTERIQRLTDSLLDMSRLEAGHPIGKRELIDPTGLMMEAIEIILPTIKSKGQTLDLAIPPELPQVLVDPDMIRRVISNLLENAAKFTPTGGKIQIGAQRVDTLLQVWVADNGPGIPSAEHERIFDKFSRLNTDMVSKGLGLGLAYCRLAVLAHDGRIWVESEPGAGARFIFSLHTGSSGG
jgi:signal transduction histidine kinase